MRTERMTGSRGFIPAMLALLMPVWAAGDEIPEEYAHVAKAFPEVSITSIGPSPVDGLLEMAVGAEFFYVTEDGKYVIRGDILQIGSFENLTEASRSAARSKYISSIDSATTIIFAADDPKYTVTVFTDIDCGYCRKLHREIDDYNARGITVRYMFFPRSGPGTPSWFKADSVWCAESRQEALTMAKNSLAVESEDCGTTPVAAHYEIVSALNLRGTPAIFTEHGQHVMGYRSADELLEILEAESAEDQI